MIGRKEIQKIEDAVNQLERAFSYLNRESVLLCRQDSVATTTEHYTNGHGRPPILPVNKLYGSDITGLNNGIVLLKSLIRDERLAAAEKQSKRKNG